MHGRQGEGLDRKLLKYVLTIANICLDHQADKVEKLIDDESTDPNDLLDVLKGQVFGTYGWKLPGM